MEDVAIPDVPDAEVVAALMRRYLLSTLEWPSPLRSRPSAQALRDLYRGCLLWGAVGDALGRAVEGQSPAAIRDRYAPGGVQDYVPWRGWKGGPRGTITDDAQLTMEVARTLLAVPGRFDCGDFARRLVDWLPIGRGKGQATTAAVEALARGEPWWRAGLPMASGGNGAAMRAAPVGLARAVDPTPWSMRRDAVLSAFATHTSSIGVAGAVAMAAGVAYCIRIAQDRPARVDKTEFLQFVSGAILETEPTMERRPGGEAIWMGDRIRELGDLLNHRSPEEVFAYVYNGAFALESVPAALYCFLRSPNDPRQVILTAVNAGYDADTVASMAGNLAGAWCGAERLQREAPEWWTELEYREELIGLADGLADLAVKDNPEEVDDRWQGT